MPQSRQLVAIMFTDIAGYTALMGNDEQKAFELLHTNRQLQQQLIKQFNGVWIKELGDGVLASFSTATDAVLCASKIQEASTDIADLKLHIGIHLGEVIFENNDVFGDGVNIASRLQTLAPGGSIWISASVYKNVSNKKDIKTKFVREEFLKNVKDPVEIYEVITNTAAIENPVELKKEEKEIPRKSVAVLPFVNMSNDPEQEYFSDGVAEEILTSLSHLKDLKVAGRTSSFQFKGKNVDLREIGKKLGVSTVLEGSVRKYGNSLRVTAQLINVQDGFHLWSERYDKTMDNIFAIQDEIAFAITEKLKVTLLENERTKISKSHTQNTEAYELYLKGRFYINRRGSFILKGLQSFQNAIKADPGFAPAFAGFAFANMLSAFYSFFPGREVMKEIKGAAEKAIKLDDLLGEAYVALGAYYVHLEWNWVEAKKNHKKAIELNPKFAQAYSLYGMQYLAWVEGKFEEAEEQGRTAVKLEPLSAIDHADLAWTLYTANRFDEALSCAKTGIELDSNSFLSHRIAGLCYLALRRYDEAIDALEYLLKISNSNQHALNTLIWVHCCNGHLEEAKRLMTELENKSTTEYIAATHLAISAAYLDDFDKAFNYFEKALNDRDPIITQLKYSPFVPASLRNDMRFQHLLERVGFPE